jgi:glycosyltransferase involved in cell wall biosynthesis
MRPSWWTRWASHLAVFLALLPGDLGQGDPTENAVDDPLVSVTTAAYNSDRWIERCVRSVLNQTVADLEMIVVDDGSSDGTWDCLTALEKQDSRLRILRHEGGLHKGKLASYRLAVDRARGRYVARLDSDDYWVPDKLERQLPALEGGALFCYGRTLRVDAEGQVSQQGGVFGVAPHEVAADLNAFECLLASGNYVPSPTAIFPRTAYYGVGGYSVPVYDDVALWARLVATASPVFVDDILAYQRVHDSQESFHILSAGRDFHEFLAALEDLREWSDLPRHVFPAMESYVRCYRSLVDLVDDTYRSSSFALKEEDAARLARILWCRGGRLLELCGHFRVYRWISLVLKLGPSFERHVGDFYKGYLKEGIRHSTEGASAGLISLTKEVAAATALKINLRWMALCSLGL